jgi:hypothetical protein
MAQAEKRQEESRVKPGEKIGDHKAVQDLAPPMPKADDHEAGQDPVPPTPKTIEAVAKLAGVSRETVRKYKKVKAKDPDAAPRLVKDDGRTSIDAEHKRLTSENGSPAPGRKSDGNGAVCVDVTACRNELIEAYNGYLSAKFKTLHPDGLRVWVELELNRINAMVKKLSKGSGLGG